MLFAVILYCKRESPKDAIRKGGTLTPKNIVLLSDGTGNSAAKAHRTNVWRLYRALDLTQGDKIALYDDSVGNQEFLPFRILGGVFGLELKRNVLD